MKKLSLLSLFTAFSVAIFANNISISNISLTGQNTANHTTQVQFTISWENSWRVSAGPSNWDAAWVFVKYKLNSQGPWLHASLNNSGHLAPGGSAISTGLLDPSSAFNPTTNAGMGAFIYRSADGSGTFTATNAQLQWNYGANGVADNAVTDVQVYGIEQVYIPQGSFAVGDGASNAKQFQLQTINTADASTQPSGVGSLGGQAGGFPYKYYGNSSTLSYTNGVGGQNTNAKFPNGYNAFYCMKYEITQQGYCDFLNSLQPNQQTNLENSGGSTTNFSMSNTALVANNPYFNNTIFRSTSPGENYKCYYAYPKGRGEYKACNFLRWKCTTAYLAWAGLRPMTELEYEKAGRGNLPPTMGEYAWGNSMAYQPNYAPSDEGSGVELPAYGYNVAVGYLADYTSSPSNQGGSNPLTGPQRVGSCAYQTTSRAQAGAGYYGVMDLTGNVEEEVVWLGDIASRTTYTGTHGNGLLDATGKVTNSDWLAITSFGLRGGSFYPADDFNPSILSHHFYVVTLSSRNFSALTADAASFTAGGRGVRTAP